MVRRHSPAVSCYLDFGIFQKITRWSMRVKNIRENSLLLDYTGV